ncbi:serine hydrolase [Nocardioides albus]|uniref:Beta-lactamase class A n=1 Tax=Nocardioides albus TaxID=1841 RepID=A0A7W5A5D2_9ACTN|nr:serine hydrolase [Nocardioides albus]MBB3089730.1 beta-lactamase class A [Nocardioides albus]GGU35193.1 serine hydrolase [Nocardioides albus]
MNTSNSPSLAAEAVRARAELGSAGLSASLLVRDLDRDLEVGVDPDDQLPLLSLAKLPIALATLERIRVGELDGSAPVTVQPGRHEVPGPQGTSRFRHPATVAIDDLVYLCLSVSDSQAADALLALTPPDQVAEIAQRLGVPVIPIRHGLGELSNTAVERLEEHRTGLGYALAARSVDERNSSPLGWLDVTHATSSSARTFVDLLAAIWTDGSGIHPEVSSRLRALLAANVYRQRLAPEFDSDLTIWSSKTGTGLNLRHEVGVAEHHDGARIAIAILSRSRVEAGVQPAADITLGRVARRLHDAVRRA